MALRTKIRTHNMFGHQTITCHNGNLSTITDGLIRIAAKVTENYAGDVIYPIDSLRNAVKENATYSVLLAFREYGVDVYLLKPDENDDLNDLTLLHDRDTEISGIQFWTLTYTPEKEEAELNRVDIYYSYAQ